MIVTPITCYLVRAATDIGEYSHKFIDGRLTTEGQAEAEKVAEFLSTRSITRMYSSTTQKAQETAEIIANRISISPKMDGRLNERSVGDAEGMTYHTAQRKFKALLSSSSYNKDWKFPNGETNLEVFNRTQDLIAEIFPKLTGKKEGLVFVSHGLNLNYFIYILHAIGFQAGMLYHFSPGSIAVLERQGGKFQLRSLGFS